MGKSMELYFEVLDIPKHSSGQEIRAAYKSLVKKWHPDKHPPSSRPQAEAKFKAISQAYEALNDQQENRAMLFGANNGGTGGGLATPPRQRSQEVQKPQQRSQELQTPRQRSQEIQKPWLRTQEIQKPRSTSSRGREFKDAYCSPPPSPSPAVPAKPALSSFSGPAGKKPPPVERKLECTLEELSRGCKKEIKFTRDVITSDRLIVRKEEVQTIRIKPGWKKGTKITFEGMGDERLGCLPADIIFIISEKEHSVFKRVGNDLVLKVEIPLVNALTGWSFSFRLLNGEKVSCVFQDEIVYPGYEKVIKGQGMPLAHEKGLKGDLRIKFHIVFPTQLSNEQRLGIMELMKNSA